MYVEDARQWPAGGASLARTYGPLHRLAGFRWGAHTGPTGGAFSGWFTTRILVVPLWAIALALAVPVWHWRPRRPRRARGRGFEVEAVPEART